MSDEKQIAAEKAEIDNAPVVAIKTGVHGRCCLCGRIRSDLAYLDSMHGQERYVGGCCGNTSGKSEQVRGDG